MLDRLFSVSPFKEYEKHFQAHLVYVDAKPGKGLSGSGRDVEFPFGSTFMAGRDFVKLKDRYSAELAAQSAPARDIVIVMSRLTGRAHASNQFILLTANDHYAVAHEMGHVLASLGDEYQSESKLLDRSPLPRGRDFREPNLTLDDYIDPTSPDTIAKTAKWGHFLDLPDAYPLVSAYQGGAHHSIGVWRPSFRCAMEDSDLDSLCPVCHETLTREIFKKCRMRFDHDAYHRDFPLKNWR